MFLEISLKFAITIFQEILPIFTEIFKKLSSFDIRNTLFLVFYARRIVEKWFSVSNVQWYGVLKQPVTAVKHNFFLNFRICTRKQKQYFEKIKSILQNINISEDLLTATSNIQIILRSLIFHDHLSGKNCWKKFMEGPKNKLLN